MRLTYIFVAAFITLQTIGVAHEFWMRPKKFRYVMGEEAKIDLVVGENFDGEFWDLSVHKVEKLEVITATARRDLTSSVKPGKGNNISYKMATQGTHLFALKSDKAFIELDAEKFNSYLAEDGIDNISQFRKDHGEID